MTVAQQVTSNFRQLLKHDRGAEFIKADLHFHTPASGDAQSKNRYNFKYDISDIPRSLELSRQLAAQIVARCQELDIRLIAVTDHNSPGNTHPRDLTNSWYNLISKAARGKRLSVLPGVEISTDDLHILVILDPGEQDPAAYATHRINFLLRDCKFDLQDYGDYRATGMSSLFDVLQYIENLDVNCIVIPAHIDGGNKSLLSVYGKPSNIYNKLLNHPNLNAIEVVKDTTVTRKKIGNRYLGEYFSSLRDKNRSPLAYIQNSDGHSIRADGLGKRFTYIKMGEVGFWGLKNALENPETRIRLAKDYKHDPNKTYILGMAYTGGEKYDFIAFNENLNTIIGRRNTRKSEILGLVLYGLGRFKAEEAEDEKQLAAKGYRVDVFVKKADTIYCFRRDKTLDCPAVFRLEGDRFKRVSKPPDLELPRRYNHRLVKELFASRTGRMDFFDRHVFRNKKVLAYLEKRNLYIEKIRAKKLLHCRRELQGLFTICQKLWAERQKQVDVVAGQYTDPAGNRLFKLKLKQGKWRNEDTSRLNVAGLEAFFRDKIEIKVFSKSRYISFERLRTGEKNAVQMVFLMNQEAFGSLIVDEPERFLDVSSLIKIVIPQLRKLKLKQQIICVTNDEHVVLSGDAEQVIVAVEEKNIDVVTGDVSSKHIQKLIVKIFEGDRQGLIEKNIKLGRLLEI